MRITLTRDEIEYFLELVTKDIKRIDRQNADFNEEIKLLERYIPKFKVGSWCGLPFGWDGIKCMGERYRYLKFTRKKELKERTLSTVKVLMHLRYVLEQRRGQPKKARLFMTFPDYPLVNGS